jgi:S1-C subfamily serine protease
MNSKAQLLRLLMAIIAVVTFTYISSACAKEQTKEDTKEQTIKERTTFFNQQWLKTVVSIERLERNKGKSEYKSIGTGFIIGSPNNHFILVTAKHVVVDRKGNVKKRLNYRVNHKSQKSIVISDKKCREKGAGDWFVSKNSDVALRIILIFAEADILKIPQKHMLEAKLLQSGTPALILGFPMGLRSNDYTRPIARKAMVARADDGNIILDGFVFPGNSGGPVVYMPALFGGLTSAKGYLKKQRLIGLVSSYITYREEAVSLQTKRTRMIFEENSGLTNVIPVDEILKIIERKDFRILDEKL